MLLVLVKLRCLWSFLVGCLFCVPVGVLQFWCDVADFQFLPSLLCLLCDGRKYVVHVTMSPCELDNPRLVRLPAPLLFSCVARDGYSFHEEVLDLSSLVPEEEPEEEPQDLQWQP